MRCTLPRTRLGLASSPALSNTARPLTGSSQVMSHPVAPRRGARSPSASPDFPLTPHSFFCAVIFDVRVPPCGLHARAWRYGPTCCRPARYYTIQDPGCDLLRCVTPRCKKWEGRYRNEWWRSDPPQCFYSFEREIRKMKSHNCSY